MELWPFWIGGVALFAVALLHWVVAGQLMSVSSRFSAIVDRLRGVPGEEPLIPHASFFGGLVLGGAVSTLVAGTFASSPLEVGERFQQLFGDDPVVHAVVVTLGGVLVGMGTRMATGCTSGHGLCGVARLQRGSLLATVAFFGTGVVVSLLLSAVLS